MISRVGPSRRKLVVGTLLAVGLVAGAGGLYGKQPAAAATDSPAFTATTLVSKRNHIWDVAPLPTGEVLFVERAGNFNVLRNGRVSQVAKISDTYAKNLGGLMGMTIDPSFSQNRLVYACFNSTAGDVRVARWRLADNFSGLTNRVDIVTGITAHPDSYHSGCRIGFDVEGYLWVGTGDGHLGTHAQQPQSLNGKMLRVDRNGAGAPGNPGGEFDPRVFNYGHRNTQGVAFFKTPKNGVLGLSSEHGTDVHDEVNELRQGNFGWAPPYPYSQVGVPMTDLNRFPDAITAKWSSGASQAPSGMTIVNGAQWKGWDGALAMAVLKDQHMKILRLDADNNVIAEERVLVGTYGRLRTVVQGPDGDLYITTDNGRTDRIIRLTPKP